MAAICGHQTVYTVCWLHLLTAFTLTHATISSTGQYDVRTMTKPTESVLIENLTSWMTSSGKASRPVQHAMSTVRVEFGISVIQIQELDQKKQKMTIHLWKEMRWKDAYLTWDPAQFQGIKNLRLSHDVIWTPDVVLYNTYENRKSDEHDVMAHVSHDGLVSWIPPEIYQSSCLVDLANFPFDTQICHMEFGSWTYTKNELKLVLSPTSNLTTDSFIKNIEWELIHYEVKQENRVFSCCPDDEYVILTYTFVLRRNAGYYTRVMLMPVLLLSVAAGFIFCIPAQRPDRTVLGLSLFTSFMLLLLLVVDISPPSSESKLSTYLSVYVCLVTSAIMLSILLINLSTWKEAMPWCLQTMILHPLLKVHHPCDDSGKYTAYCNRRPSTRGENGPDVGTAALSGRSATEDTHVETQPPRRPDRVISDWALLVNLIDRSLFIIYAVCLIVCVVLYFPRPESQDISF